MKAVNLLVDSLLPEDMRGAYTEYDARGVDAMMADLAKRHPDDYTRVSKAVGDVGRLAAYRQGATLSTGDLRLEGLDKDSVFADMDTAIAKLDKSSPEYGAQRSALWHGALDELQDQTVAAALGQGTNLGHTILSGARGKPAQLRAMVATPGLYEDAKGEVIPLLVRRSFAEGLRPAEMLAGTYGARTSVISTKKNTAKGGDWGKQLTQAGATIPITSEDCGTTNGIDLEADDESLRGRVLAIETAGIPAGTVIGKKEAATIRKHGKKVIVRSPVTCSAAEGLCSQCLGEHFDNKFSKVGDSVGVTAAHALSEPVIQAGLNVKHQSGMSDGGGREYAGLPYLVQFTQVPKAFKDRAALAETAGTVEAVEDAPQGGKYITVAGEKHYTAPGNNVLVRVGDSVDAGDQLAAGFKSPADVVRLKGLGEGRRYFAEGLKKVLDASGQPAHIKNTELMARALVDGVIIDSTDSVGDYLPDDAASYNALAAHWTPADDAGLSTPKEARGRYLHAPALHYSIGTKVDRSMEKRLKAVGISEVLSSKEVPGFVPEMVRMRAATHGRNDWLASQSTSYLKKQLLDAAARGGDTNIESNTHYAPRLVVGADFGKNINTTGAF